MTEQTAPSWQGPERTAGPAPGVEFGEFGPRLVAYIVDILIVAGVSIGFVILWGLFAAGSALTGGRLDGGAVFVGVLAFVGLFVVSLGYFPFFWARSGATPGMRMMSLQVVRDHDGGPISTGQAILRLVGYWVSGLVFYLGYIWIFVDKRRRGWHDLIAGTVVIRRA